MRGPGAGGDVGGRIGVGIFRHQIDVADTLRMQLERDLLRRQIAVDMLAAGHRGGVVVGDLVGDVGGGGDALGDAGLPERKKVPSPRLANTCSSLVNGATPTQGTPSPPICVNVSVLRSIHSAMKWQPMPAIARLPSGTLVEGLCGQPEQKYGVRLIGETACIWLACRPLNQSALARSISAISGLRLSRKSRSVSELASEATLSSAAKVRNRLS